MDLDSFSPSDMGAYLLGDYERLTKKVGSDALDPSQKEVARLLRTDERMGAVWRVIFEKSSKGGFRYPSKSAPLNPYLKALKLAGKRIEVLKRMNDEASAAELRTMMGLQAGYREQAKAGEARIAKMTDFQRQLRASRYLYLVTIQAFGNAAVVTKSDLTDLHLDIEIEIDSLRELSKKYPFIDTSEQERELCKLAIFSEMGFDGDSLLVKRHNSDMWLRGFIITLGMETKALFDQPLYGSLATLANVSFQRTDISGRAVTDLLRNGGSP